jgi:type III secretory pathway component EscR
VLVAVIAAGFAAFLLNNELNDRNIPTGLLIGAAALVIAYFLTRAVALAISSPGQSIKVSARGVKQDALVTFVDEVEQAKLMYLGKVKVGDRGAS